MHHPPTYNVHILQKQISLGLEEYLLPSFTRRACSVYLGGQELMCLQFCWYGQRKNLKYFEAMLKCSSVDIVLGRVFHQHHMKTPPF